MNNEMTETEKLFQLNPDDQPAFLRMRLSIVHVSVCGAIIAFYFCCLGCGFLPFYPTGKRFDANRIAEVVEQRTTRDDVMEMFGIPVQTNLGETLQASWWRYEYTYIGFLDVEQAALEINFADNLVDRYVLSIDRRRY
jgi:hypothetical protein